MPMMDGVTLLEQVHDYFPYIKSIIISGFSDFDYARRAIRIQVSEYLLKPVDPQELYQSLVKVKTSLDQDQEEYNAVLDDSWLRSNPEQLAFTLKTYIQNNFREDINLNVIAQKLNYSAAWLTKLFCQQYDTTPSRYLLGLRIAQAKSLLAHNPDMSIKQIGEMIGYQDQGYFSRIFKKNTGLSPIEYRDSLNQKN
jgi:YesN/AraC family two-component response regulator